MSALAENLRARLPELTQLGGTVLFDEPLAKHTYYRIGGPADVLAAPKSVAELGILAEVGRQSRASVHILGLGSNTLAADEGYRGLVLKATRLDLGIEELGPGRIRTGGSVAISTLLRKAAVQGWGGLEFLTGVPGAVGGAVRMNAGTHLGETKDRLLSISAFLGFCRDEDLAACDLEFAARDRPVEFEGPALRMEYRKSPFLPARAVVLEARWRVDLASPEAVQARIDENLVRRKASQPIDLPSCGSVFKNPRDAGVSAWQVVDRLGLRGHRIGNAQISEKHSNFIVNLGGATAADVRALIRLVKSRASAELKIAMHEEVVYLGGGIEMRST